MIAPPPQKQKKSLRDIFNHFSAEAVERFPDLKGRLLILDMNEYRAYGCDAIDHEKTGLTPDTAHGYLGNHSITQEMRENKNKSSCAGGDPARNLNMIFINDRIDEKELNNVSEKTEKEMLLTLDHELAHRAIANGNDQNNLYTDVIAESIADAYALIRHYQRFGVDSDYHDLAYNPVRRTRNMVWNDDKDHFTSFVLDEIIKRRHLIDFDRLDPAQTASLAWRFAMEYAPAAPVVERIHRVYEPLREAYKASTEANDLLKVLTDVVLNPENGYYTFKAGSQWLMYFLETRTFFNGEPINLPAEYLDDALKKLKEREFKFAQEDILFNMPIVASPQPAPANQNIALQVVRS